MAPVAREEEAKGLLVCDEYQGSVLGACYMWVDWSSFISKLEDLLVNGHEPKG